MYFDFLYTDRKHWSAEEIEAVEKHLSSYLFSKVTPGKRDILKCLQAEKILEHRSWLHVKNYIRNRNVSCAKKKKVH